VRTRVAEIRELGPGHAGRDADCASDEGSKLSGLQRIVENDANVADGAEGMESDTGPAPDTPDAPDA